jgi:hypothetical protein
MLIQKRKQKKKKQTKKQWRNNDNSFVSGLEMLKIQYRYENGLKLLQQTQKRTLCIANSKEQNLF